MNVADRSWRGLPLVDAALPQRLAHALGDAAVGLAVDEQRVDRAADVVDRGVARDPRRRRSRGRSRPRTPRSRRRRTARVMVSSATPASGPRSASGASARRAAAATSNRPTERSVPRHGEATARELDVRLRRLEEPGGDARAARDDLVGGLAPSPRAPRRMERPELDPPPTATRSVSPVTRRTCSSSTPSHSARIWAKLVSWPWPADSVPSTSSTCPAGSTVISARSRGAPVFSSMYWAMPMPR